MVDARAQVAGLEEVHAVQVGDVNAPLVGRWTVGAILLHVHAEEAHIHSVNLFEGKKCFGSVGKCLGHVACVHEPVIWKIHNGFFTICM